MISEVLYGVLFFTFVLYCYSKLIRKPHNYPPGPPWYPFIGCNPVVQTFSKKYGSQWKGMLLLAKEYSTDILGLKLGSELTVVVYGENNVRQVFTGSEFQGRPDSFFLKLRCFGKISGITSADGPLWKEHRKFTVKHLKNIGFGKSIMESEIQNEARYIIEYLKSVDGMSVEPVSLLGPSVMNILWKFVAGEKIAQDRLKKLLELMHLRSKAFSMAGGVLNIFPWIRFILPRLSGYALIKNINDQLRNIIDEAIDKHRNQQAEKNDFIFEFFNEMKDNKETFTHDQLRVICLDLLIAGSQTTSNMLGFALLAVLRDIKLQNKIYEEIFNNIGNSKPCWNDSHKLTYTSSFLLEVQRYYTIVPLAGPRRVLWDTTIDGYSIPKGCTVLLSVADVHFNPRLWKDPYEFKPDRFLDKDGYVKHPENNFYPFGLGRRRCPGDSLAKSFIFILFVHIMQNFKIMPTDGTVPSNVPVIGLIAAPERYSAIFLSRC